ncbi:MAG: hypothetical protein JST04_04840 [Bdellovibrionales bacterium]|nr:hypothetical protein [Bdellovibrionales bacterium]
MDLSLSKISKFGWSRGAVAALAFVLSVAGVQPVRAEGPGRQDCIANVTSNEAFKLEASDGRVFTFRSDVRSSAEKRFKAEAKLYEEAADDDLVSLEWIYHPFYAVGGHNTLRVGNTLYEFTQTGWKIHETGADTARAFLYNNPLFKRMYENYRAKGMPGYSIGVPIKVPKWKVKQLDKWVRQYPSEGGKPFSMLFNNCAQCALNALDKNAIGDFRNGPLNNFSSLKSTRSVLLQKDVPVGDPTLYVLTGNDFTSEELRAMLPPSIYGKGKFAETKLDLTVTKDAVVETYFTKSVPRDIQVKIPEKPYEIPKVPSGKFAGTELSSLRPSIALLSKEEIQTLGLNAREGSTLMKNFLSETTSYYADIPKAPPEGISLLVQTEQATGKVQHVQLVFRYSQDNPVLLLKPMDEAAEALTEPEPVYTMLFDATAWLPAGQEGKFNVKDAAAGRYGLQHRLRDADPVFKMESERGRDLLEYEIKANPSERRSVIQAILARNDEVNKGMMYEYYRQHCGTEVINALDAIREPTGWTAKIRNWLYELFGRKLANTPRVLAWRGLIDPRNARPLVVGGVGRAARRLKDGKSFLPLSYGLELEFELSRAPNIVKYYRRFDIPEFAWNKMSDEARIKALNDTTPNRSWWRNWLTVVKKNKLQRISGGPEWLPKTLTIEGHGTYEVNGVIRNTIDELTEARKQYEDLFGPGSLQVHVVFPKSRITGAAGYMVYKSDESIITNLEISYEKYLKNPKKKPARRLIYWALGPMSEWNRQFFLANERVATLPKKFPKLGGRRLISGPVLRDDAYPAGYLGFELRQFAEGATDLIDEAEDLTVHLEKGTLKQFTAYENVELVSLELIPKYFARTGKSGSGPPAAWQAFFQSIGDELEKTFYFKIAGGARGRERFLIPLRDWENYPAVQALPKGERATVIADLRAAGDAYHARVEEIMNGKGTLAEKIDDLRVAIGEWSDRAKLSRVFKKK